MIGELMSNRQNKDNKTVLAICYDFDKTLSPDDMQAQGYIQEVGCDVKEFWDESNALAKDNDMDQNLAYMYKMMEKARGKVLFTRKNLEDYGSKVSLFPGVENWFERINKYGQQHGVIVEHYIISCGLKEMIEGTSVAQKGVFKKIYASSFMYDENNVAIWPSQVVNFTSKTQFLFRIQKGVLDINDSGVNEFFAPEDIRVPFRNIVYIGDSDTDIPCMKLVNSYGGHSIGVYNNTTLDKTKVYKMMRDNRIRYYASADYTEDSDLDKLLKAIIDRTATNEILEKVYLGCKKDQENYSICSMENENQKKKLDLILRLDASKNFATTHSIIRDLVTVEQWTEDEIDMLLDIAINKHPVRYLLNDLDVKMFYSDIITQLPNENEKSRKVESYFDKE